MKEKISAVFSALFFGCAAIAGAFQLYMPKSSAAAEGVILIPDEAIRMRILAHSNSERDQELKREIRDEVNALITGWIRDLSTLEEARRLIRSRLPEVKRAVHEILEQDQVRQPVSVEYGMADFPTKLYGNFLYPAGTYEALLITIGEGKGDNWWCVLFPPLCFLDFSTSTAVRDGDGEEKRTPVREEKAEKKDETREKKEESGPEITPEGGDREEVRIKFFIVEWFKKWFQRLKK